MVKKFVYELQRYLRLKLFQIIINAGTALRIKMKFIDNFMGRIDNIVTLLN